MFLCCAAAVAAILSTPSHGQASPAVTILLCCLQDTEQLVAAGANQLEVAQRWEQQTQVRSIALRSIDLTAAAARLCLHTTIATALQQFQGSAATCCSVSGEISKPNSLLIPAPVLLPPPPLPLTFVHCPPHPSAALQSPLVSLASVTWAAAVLLGRSFQLDMSEPELPLEPDMSWYGSWQAHGPAVLALVPWADMLRHSSEAGAAPGS